MIAAIGLVIGLTLAVFIAFWGTLILTGNFTAAVWAVACLPVVAILVRLICAALDSNWHWRWKHRHDPCGGPMPPQPLDGRGLDEAVSADRPANTQSEKAWPPSQLPGLRDLGPFDEPAPENSNCASCPEEFEKFLEVSLEIIRQEQRASTSLLQRRTGFGFKLANALINELVRRGILAPGEGAQPRQILVDLNAAL